MDLKLNSDTGFAVAFLAVAAAMALGPWLLNESSAKVAVSCNNLKAAAIAASQPEPVCAK